jgi:hypothetical protein
MSILKKNKIEFRPFIAGNLLKQPFLKHFNSKFFLNSNFLHENALYIGNNQFVDKKKFFRLKNILNIFFSKNI